jgi:hypothetical protein
VHELEALDAKASLLDVKIRLLRERAKVKATAKCTRRFPRPVRGQHLPDRTLDSKSSAKPSGPMRGIPASFGQRTNVSAFPSSIRHGSALSCHQFHGGLLQDGCPLASVGRRQFLAPGAAWVAKGHWPDRGKAAGANPVMSTWRHGHPVQPRLEFFFRRQTVRPVVPITGYGVLRCSPTSGPAKST